MKYDLISDMHVEFFKHSFDWAENKLCDSDVLVIAGDISNDLNLTMDELKRASLVYNHVIWCDGNHEHYVSASNIINNMDNLREVSNAFSNVTYLYPGECKIIGNTAFVGSNGWYDFNVFDDMFSFEESKQAWYDYINDSKYINFGELQPEEHASYHRSTLCDVVSSLSDDVSIENIVITTHTIPHRSLCEESLDRHWNLCTGSFCNSLMFNDVLACDFNKKVKVWNYGHTHRRKEKTVNGVYCINNCCGYPRESSSKWFMAQVEV